MIYLFGLVGSDSETAVARSLAPVVGDTAPLVSPVRDDLFLVFAPHDGSDILPRRRAMLHHASVLEHAMHAGTVLPMQFGMLAASQDAVAQRVAAKTTEVAAAIETLRGRVELGVRLAAAEEDALDATLQSAPAIRQMRDRLARSRRPGHFQVAEFGRVLGDALARRRAAEQRRATADLAPFADASVLKAPESDAQVLRAEFLVKREASGQFTAAVEAFCDQSKFTAAAPLQARIVGPGPAYNFLKLSLGDAPDEVAA
ncbi:MAG: GvpL/GvpF family gas vesicle protein [Pseudomonadota bacterium]